VSKKRNVSIPYDAVSLVQRPWPARAPGASPLRGRRVLVVDDELDHARTVAGRLTPLGCVARAVTSAEVPAATQTEAWPLTLAEPACFDGACLAAIGSSHLLLFAPAKDTSPVAAVAARAQAYLPRDPDEAALRLALGRALEREALEDENRRLRAELEVRGTFGAVITRDSAMKQVLRTLESVAETRANVLLLGESGTGKTRLAQAVHKASDRAAGPFVVVNCGALPDSLLESELFGHVRGAFSGAVRDRAGRFEQADGGTLFLDEINSASLDLQVKLLRVIQERAFERVGDGQTLTVDVRLIAASNKDLPDEIAAGRFREDLYWRLHVVAVELPPLRARPGDVALLAAHFLRRYADEYGRPIERLHPAALSALAGAPWPGNVRQLENVLERAVLLAEGTELRTEDLGPEVLGPGGPPAPETHSGTLLQGLENLARLPPLKEALEGPERQILVRALELSGGNRKAAAEMLGINRTTLFNKMRKYGLMDLDFEAAPRRP
jgi:DNA-binding NtrC family response regulator